MSNKANIKRGVNNSFLFFLYRAIHTIRWYFHKPKFLIINTAFYFEYFATPLLRLFMSNGTLFVSSESAVCLLTKHRYFVTNFKYKIIILCEVNSTKSLIQLAPLNSLFLSKNIWHFSTSIFMALVNFLLWCRKCTVLVLFGTNFHYI